MEGGNETSSPKEFVLIGLTNHPKTKLALFVVFTIIYSAAVIGNLLIALLVKTDSCLHTPMYFFLSNFSILEFCYTSTVMPQMLFHLLSERKIISFTSCALQVYFFLTFGTTECFLLTVMSYDRYAAICFPLRYNLMITKQTCIAMAAASWLGGFFVSAINSTFTFKVSFSGNKIDHFFCEVPALMRIASEGTHQAQLCMSITCVFTLVLPLSLILVSYARILGSILGSHGSSFTGRHKAFSTCSSHLIVVTLFFGTVLSMYVKPHHSNSMAHIKIASIIYIVITPALNPIIYSLRNKEVLQALKKITNKSVVIN